MISFLRKVQAVIGDSVSRLNCFLASHILNKQLQTKVDNEIEASLAMVSDGYDEIVNAVKTRGFYILPNALSDVVLNQMRQEFRTIIKGESNGSYAVDKHEGSVCVRMKPVLTLENARFFSAIHAFFNSAIFRKLTKLYYLGEKFGSEYMTEIFVHETPETNDPLSGELHWDRTQTLKFWVYLDEVSENAGPMIVEENSAERNRKMRIKMHQEKSTLVGGVDNVLSQTVNNLIPMAAPAGSILIHNTDASHGASNVLPGNVRRIVRGHCRARSCRANG